MPKNIASCPICKKTGVSETGHGTIGKTRFITLNCGHTYTEKLNLSTETEILFKDGKKARHYQVEGIRFVERSGFNCLIGDAPGVGKTIQATGTIHLHYDELKPILIVVKASLTYQWQKYILQQLDKYAQILSTTDNLLPNFGIYITSYDCVDKLLPKLEKRKIRTLILDECQMIKNHEAKRTGAIRKLVSTRIPKNGNSESEDKEAKSVRLKRIETIALDLMKFHGISDRFKFSFSSDLPRSTYGITKCKPYKTSISQVEIVGDIVLNKHWAEIKDDSFMIETILHEIAHAICPGAGHKPLWIDTAKSIGSTGDAYAPQAVGCVGSIDPSSIQDDGKERMIKYKIFLSGTPIKNNAVEYWPSLNLLRPEMFPNRADWMRYEVGYWLNSKGKLKPGGLRYPEEFKKRTSDFIIRRERQEVFPELPEITRDFRYHEISDIEMGLYKKGVKKLADFLKNSNSKSPTFASDLQGHIMILRHITGLAKVNPILEFIDEMNESGVENWKLPIFHYHQDVGDALEQHIAARDIGYERIVAANDAQLRDSKRQRLKNDDDCHILIVPLRADSEGYDLDFCETGLILERDWNAVTEEQIEGRFIRATEEFLAKSREGLTKPTILYPVAVGTIDEFFCEMVERKRQYVNESLQGKQAETKWSETEIMLALAEIAVKKLEEIDGTKI